uniref:Uncharacterized protein n=1 Tax=Coccidioides posadasii RMSCC 3488 TaxID=454284 RepID=A0A0J6FF61_COCPO|nr:hypothetical protein CPAG_08111 [Coccidioides posadasii RMSCC 3488]
MAMEYNTDRESSSRPSPARETSCQRDPDNDVSGLTVWSRSRSLHLSVCWWLEASFGRIFRACIGYARVYPDLTQYFIMLTDIASSMSERSLDKNTRRPPPPSVQLFSPTVRHQA